MDTQFQTATQSARDFFGRVAVRQISHFIDGKLVEGKSGRFADVFNPATGEVQAKVPLASSEELAFLFI